MADADKKVDDARKELDSAQKYQKKGGKCVCCLVWIIILSLGILALILYFSGVFDTKKDDNNK